MAPDVEESARGRPRGRPRSEQTHRAILEATVDLLRERGYGGLAIEAVAARAGVGKRTIYRWWPSKGALVAEAYAAAIRQTHPDPDTGAVREDLELMVGRLVRRAREPEVATAMRSMMAEAQADAAWAQQFAGFVAERRTVLRAVLERGVARGELRADADLDAAVDAIFGPYWYRVLVGHAPLDDAFSAALVDQLLSGLLRA